MKRLLVTTAFIMVAIVWAPAQTWTGSSNTDWNNPNNWSPTAIPIGTSNVIIPGTVGSGRWPQLTSDVTINTLSTNYGSQLDVNGFAMTLNTVSANNNLQGLTVNNSVPASNIVINIAGGTGGFSTAFLRNVFNGNLVLNINGYFYEGNVGAPDNSSASTYNGHTTINMNAIAAMGISNTNYSTFNGNLTINRNARVTLDLFGAGGIVNGNFTFNDVGGGKTILGNTFYRSIPVSGTLNISVNYPEYNDFSLHRFVNQTAGGSISIQHVGIINITRDTLKVNSIALTDFATNYVYILSNLIHGDLSVSDNASNTYPTTIRDNTVNGNCTFNNNGTGTFHEADQPNNGNTFNGTTSFIANSSGTLNISAVSHSYFNGNLSITRNAAGITTAFGGGADIAGNFNFTNNTSGATTLGNKNTRNTNITGKIDIIAQYNSGSGFAMYRIVNTTSGGNINIENTTGFDLYKDTLVVNSLHITGYKGGFGYLQNNRITGNVEIADDATNGNNYFTYIRSNNIFGNTAYSCNGINTFLDADVNGSVNHYYGNVTYSKGNTGSISIGSVDTVVISGNLTLSSTGGIVPYKVKFIGENNSTFEQLGTQVTNWTELIMQKASAQYSLTLLDSISMSGKLTFVKGHIISANGRELIFAKTGTSSGASDESHVIGPVVKLGNAAFTFPVGNATHIQAVTMTAPGTNLDRYRCEYIFASPHPTYDTGMHATSIIAMGNCEYWNFKQDAGTSQLKLTFDFGSPCGEIYTPSALRVARWSGSLWEDLGNGGFTGTGLSGTVSTASNLSSYGIFTLASVQAISPSVLISKDYASPVCVCATVTFSAVGTFSGGTPFYQWKKNNINVGTNSPTYTDSTLHNDDAVTCLMTSSGQFAFPPVVNSNVIFIATTATNNWTGAQDNNWYNKNNWSCGSLPCELTDVIINSGTANGPTIPSGIANCRSILVKTGATLQISPNAKLNVTIQQ